MATVTNFTISPNLYHSSASDSVTVTFCNEHELESHLPAFYKSITDDVIGVAPLYVGLKCNLDKVAIASKTQVLIITPLFSKKKQKASESLPESPENSLRVLLCHAPLLKCAFQMDRLAASFFLNFGIRISNGKDLLSLSRVHRQSFAAFMAALGGELGLNRRVAKELHLGENTNNKSVQALALQAWAAVSSAVLPSASIQLELSPSINTQNMDKNILKFISTTIHNGTRQMLTKPLNRRNEVIADTTSAGEIRVESQRYKTRVMRTNGEQQIIIDAVSADGKVSTYSGRTVEVTGRLATLSINGDVKTSQIQSMETVGRDRQTISETVKLRLMLSALQKTINLEAYAFISEIFLKKNASWENAPSLASSPGIYYPSGRPLNESQTEAVNAILSGDDSNRVVIIHGPPGTGKTTVIAASVTSIMTLMRNDFNSAEDSDEDDDSEGNEDSDSNESSEVKEDSEVEDDSEAEENSEVDERISEGDEDSEPNEGSEADEDSGLEDESASDDDSTYRMPIPIGNFISKEVYGGQLKSEHSITDPQCCTFVDVSNGAEEAQGHSWKNIREVDVALAIAKQLTAAGRSFRIITPYDSQRSLLERALKGAKLPWEDKCFNIDAFQGNEDDYIVISLVRSSKLGFLQDTRRVNVMLTRCRKGMIVCTSRKFLEGSAAESLVGRLREAFPTSGWIDGRQVQHAGVRPFM